MSCSLFAACGCAVVLIGLVPVRAQTLAEAARREEARRKAIANPSKVYTNADLKPVPRPSAPPAADEKKSSDDKKDAADTDTKDGNAKTAKDEKGAKEPAKEPVKDRAYWADRLKTLQEQLARDETYAEALQSRINALTTDFINRDDPAQKRVLEQTRLTALAELDRLKQRIPDDKKALADFQEDARRAGVPPGWLR
jgi:hypothetical protein